MPASPALARVEERPDCHREARWREAAEALEAIAKKGPKSRRKVLDVGARAVFFSLLRQSGF